MKKLNVNENCIGCGMCVSIDPEHFEIVDGLSKAINNENLESEALNDAMDSCPTNAIEINEVEENAIDSCQANAIEIDEVKEEKAA